MKAIVALLGLAWMVSCHEKVKEIPVPSDIDSSQIAIQIDSFQNKVWDHDTTVLATATAFRFFSDSLVKDRFVLTMRGKRVLSALVFFQVFDPSNQLIHAEKFTAGELLEGRDDEMHSDKEKQDTVMAKMNHFFDEERFHRPAIDAGMLYESEYPNEDVWNEIKADRRSIGFTYNYGYEGTYRIAYSRKQRKAVLYFYSD